MENKKHKMVGAPRFELGTSCAQASRAISWKSFLFNLYFGKIKGLAKEILVARCMKRWLRMHEVPPIFPSAKKQRNTF
jgi:hypothetical protein